MTTNDPRCGELDADPENKIANTINLRYHIMLHRGQITTDYRSGVSSILVLNEKIETLFHLVMFLPFDPFFEAYNILMGRLANGGFLNYWFDNVINPKGVIVKIHKIGPQVLTMEHLMIGFQIFLIAIAISGIAFSAEISRSFLQNFKLNIETKICQKVYNLLKPKQQKYRSEKFKKTITQIENIAKLHCK